jgi:hypothetical protein
MGMAHQHRCRRARWVGGLLASSHWFLWSLALAAGSESLYDHLISAAARQYGFGPALVKAVIKCESGFNPLAVSPRGAQGLMQLMPATQALLGVSNAFTPQENIVAGVRYLAMLQQLFPGNVSLMLAAYNAGPQAVIAAGSAVPEFPETRRYVQCVLAAWQRYRQPGDDPTMSGARSPLAPAVPDSRLQVQALRMAQPVGQVGQRMSAALDIIQGGPQTSHGVVMLMYPEHLVSYMMLNTSGNATTVRLPEASAGQLGKVSWVANTYQILRGDWPEWRPGQQRTLAFALVPKVSQDITVHLSIFLYNSMGGPEQHRWSQMVRLPVRPGPW